jgi:hypothetical protein
MVVRPLVDTTASIVQLRHEILVASDQQAHAAARNAAVVKGIRQTLSATLAAQRRRRAEVEEEVAQARRLKQQDESVALHAELGEVLARRERARAEFDGEVSA